MAATRRMYSPVIGAVHDQLPQRRPRRGDVLAAAAAAKTEEVMSSSPTDESTNAAVRAQPIAGVTSPAESVDSIPGLKTPSFAPGMMIPRPCTPTKSTGPYHGGKSPFATPANANSGLAAIRNPNNKPVPAKSLWRRASLIAASTRTLVGFGLGKTIPVHHVTDEVWAKFQALDTNRDGHLDISEVIRLTDALGVRFTKSELKSAFHLMDEGKSGEIDLTVFARWWSAQVDFKCHQLRGRVKDMFDECDQDKSGAQCHRLCFSVCHPGRQPPHTPPTHTHRNNSTPLLRHAGEERVCKDGCAADQDHGAGPGIRA